MNKELVRLHQLSEMLEKNRGIPIVPKKGWLFSIRTALWMTAESAAKRAGVTKAAWMAAEKREILESISIMNLKKFLMALDCTFEYMPISEISLEKMLEKQALKFTKEEVATVHSTMALEDQALWKTFSDMTTKNQTEDIIRSGNWKKIWQ